MAAESLSELLENVSNTLDKHNVNYIVHIVSSDYTDADLSMKVDNLLLQEQMASTIYQVAVSDLKNKLSDLNGETK